MCQFETTRQFVFPFQSYLRTESNLIMIGPRKRGWICCLPPACTSQSQRANQRLRQHKKALTLNPYLTFSIRPDMLHSWQIIKGQTLTF